MHLLAAAILNLTGQYSSTTKNEINAIVFQVTFTIESIRKFINSQFVLKSYKDNHTTLKLRGGFP